MKEMKCQRKFYMTSLSSNTLNEKEYDHPGGLPFVGNYYVVIYEGELWPGQLTEVNNEQTMKVKCLWKADTPKGST